MHRADKSNIIDTDVTLKLCSQWSTMLKTSWSDDTEWEKLVAWPQDTMPHMSLLSDMFMKTEISWVIQYQIKKKKKSRCSWSTCVSNVSLPWDEYQWMSSYQAWCGPRALPSVAACCCIPHFHTADMHTSSRTGMIILREQQTNVQRNNVIIAKNWVCMKAIMCRYHVLINCKY